MIYAQIEKSTNKIIMFIGAQYPELLAAHKEANPDCFYVQTEFFGSPRSYVYDPSTGEISAIPPTA
jgi:hypothetical protein